VSGWVDLTFFGSVFVTLLVIMDPPGIVPIFLALTAKRTPREMRRLALQATVTSFVVITVFAVFGEQVLSYLKISLPALQGAGGLLLLLVALELLTGKAKEPEAEEDVSVALVPLGTPLLAGPGAIVATILVWRPTATGRPRRAGRRHAAVHWSSGCRCATRRSPGCSSPAASPSSHVSRVCCSRPSRAALRESVRSFVAGG
jgi:small neutral amino acid transporter SnatA (MarC family)